MLADLQALLIQLHSLLHMWHPDYLGLPLSANAQPFSAPASLSKGSNWPCLCSVRIPAEQHPSTEAACHTEGASTRLTWSIIEAPK